MLLLRTDRLMEYDFGAHRPLLPGLLSLPTSRCPVIIDVQSAATRGRAHVD